MQSLTTFSDHADESESKQHPTLATDAGQPICAQTHAHCYRHKSVEACNYAIPKSQHLRMRCELACKKQCKKLRLERIRRMLHLYHARSYMKYTGTIN